MMCEVKLQMQVEKLNERTGSFKTKTRENLSSFSGTELFFLKLSHVFLRNARYVKLVKGFLSKQVPMVQTFKCIFAFCKFPFIIRHIL